MEMINQLKEKAINALNSYEKEINKHESAIKNSLSPDSKKRALENDFAHIARTKAFKAIQELDHAITENGVDDNSADDFANRFGKLTACLI